MFIASDLTRLVYELGYSEQQVFDTNIIQEFINLESIYDLKDKLEHYCDRFLEFLESEKEQRNLKLVKRAIKYMEENIANDISLISVADAIGIGPTLFSKIFKEQMGIKFVDYCSNLKLEYAQKLLEQGNMDIDEISQTIGYSQTRYFIKKFKNQYGITPKQYQMKFAQETSLINE